MEEGRLGVFFIVLILHLESRRETEREILYLAIKDGKVIN